MRVALALLAAASVYGQASPTSPILTTISAAPSSWYAAGLSGSTPHGSPYAGWWAIGTRLSAANDVWSISGNDYLIIKGQIVAVPWTALATICKSFTFATLFCYGGAGAATTATATNGVFTGGGFLAIPLNKAHTWDAFIGAADFKIGSSTPDTVRFGLGYRF